MGMRLDHAQTTAARVIRRSRGLALLVGLALAWAPESASAQSPTTKPSPQDPAALSQTMSQMAPMYEAMMQAMMDGTLKALERPENIERLAVFMRRYYETLIKQGFSREEAFQIVAGVGVPALKVGR